MKNLVRVPSLCERVLHSCSHEVVGVRLEKKNIFHSKLNGEKNRVNNRLLSHSAIVWRRAQKAEGPVLSSLTMPWCLQPPGETHP